jgi:hypothetical protein
VCTACNFCFQILLAPLQPGLDLANHSGLCSATWQLNNGGLFGGGKVGWCKFDTYVETAWFGFTLGTKTSETYSSFAFDCNERPYSKGPSVLVRNDQKLLEAGQGGAGSTYQNSC